MAEWRWYRLGTGLAPCWRRRLGLVDKTGLEPNISFGRIAPDPSVRKAAARLNVTQATVSRMWALGDALARVKRRDGFATMSGAFPTASVK